MNSRNSKVRGPRRKRGTGQKNKSCRSAGASDVESHVGGAEFASEPVRNPTHLPRVDAAPKFLGDKMLALADGEQGERKHVTILVADIPDYSSISSKLDPEEAYEIMTGCLSIMGKRISHYGGTMTQVTGGIVKGLFGAPVSHEDHAKRACEAALSIRNLVGSYREEIRTAHDVDFEIRIGLASGTIVAQSLSGETELDSGDLDELDDLIPTIKGMTKPSRIVATKATYELVSDFFEFQIIDKEGQQVEGYEVVSSRGLPSLIRARELRGLSKFVGREQEMSILLEAVEKARQGRGKAVAVTGDAGVGKSRLALEFKKTLPTGKQTFLEGYCRSYDGVPPYHPLLDILKSIFGIQPGERQSSIKKKMRRLLFGMVDGYEELLAPLHEIFALKVEDESYLGLPFQEKRNRIFRAVEAILVGASREHLLVVIVEDLHWIDRSSEEVLNYLTGRIDNAKILLMLLYRPECTAASRQGAVTEIHLEHISHEYVRELVQSVLGASEVGDDLVTLVFDKTGGNPLFVEEFTRALSDGGAIQESGGKFILTQGASAEVLPKTIQDVITSRMDRLGKDVKQTLQFASVIGSEFHLALLERITESGEDIRSHISRLQELEFIREERDRRFAFKHALTQEAAYTSLLTRPRLKIHQKTAEAVEKLYSDRLEDFYEQLAYHFGKSRNLRKEFKYLKLSAMKASRQNSAWQAYQFGKEALRCLKSQPATLQNKKGEIEVLTVMDWVVRMLDYAAQDVEQLMKRGETLSLEIGDTKSLSRFRAALCLYYVGIGNASLCRKYSEYLLKDVQALGNALYTKEQLNMMVPTAVDFTFSALKGVHTSEVLSLNLRVLKSMENTQTVFQDYKVSFNAYSFLAGMSAFLLSWLGNFDDAVRLCFKALDVALEVGNSTSLGFAEFHCSTVLGHRGCGPEAVGHAMNSVKYFEAAKGGSYSNVMSADATAALGHAQLLANDISGAQMNLEKAIRMHVDLGLPYYTSLYYSYLTKAHLVAGDMTKAQCCIDLALERARKNDEKHLEALAKILFGKILAEREVLQAAKAETSILEGIDILSKLGLKPYCAEGYLYLGELRVNTGRTELGIKNLKKAERMFKEMGMEYWLHKTQEILGRFQMSS